MLEDADKSAEIMKRKGGMGMARMLLMEKETGVIDFTTIALPTQEHAMSVQAQADWGSDWVSVCGLLDSPCRLELMYSSFSAA